MKLFQYQKDPERRPARRKLRISVKFFLMFLISSSLAIGSFSLFVSIYFSNILVEKEISSFQALTSSFLAQIENEIKIMDDVSINIFYSTQVHNNFTNYLNDSQNNHQSFLNMLEVFVALNGANFSLPVIALYSDDGQKIIMSRYSVTEQVNMSDLTWVNAVSEIKYHKLLSLPYTSSMMQYSRNVSPYYISLYRALRDRSGADIGYIETAQYAKDIFSCILTHHKRVDDGLKVYVFNDNGDLVFPYEDAGKNGKNLDYYRVTSSEGPAREYVDQETGKKELLYSKTSFYTGWTYICVQDMDKVLLPVRNISRILLYATCITLLTVILISFYLSTSITKPIRVLLKKIHATSIDTLSGEKKYLNSAYNEFDDLNDAFYTMSENLKGSMDELLHSRQREMESRFLALQSQINPHFYYNSLSSIIALTEEHREDEVVQFCDTLSRFMRYTAKNQPGIVALSTELEYVEKYLYCMKVRYQKSLTYSVRIDDRLREIRIPKLLVQPFVENAVKYGTDCVPPWHISVNANVRTNGWILSVSDSGTGFSDHSLDEFKKKTEEWNNVAVSEYTDEAGLGLINVYSRWKIFTGEDFYFKIDSSGKGSTVTIGQIKGGVFNE